LPQKGMSVEGFRLISGVKEKSMEREAEELQLLGVGEEAFNIDLRSSRGKLVRTLAFTLLLPLSFATLVLCLIPGYLLESVDELTTWIQSVYEETILIENMAGEHMMRTITSTSGGLQQLLTTNGGFEFWMLSTAAVMYTAASIYTGNEASFAKAMTVVPRVWKHLALTLLWFFAIVFVHTTVYIMAFFLLIYTVGFDKYVNSRDLLFGSVQMLAVFFCVLVYINMVGYLASVISVLQEKYYGLAAMRKRKHLIKRKRTTVLSLVMLYFIFSQGIGLFWYAVFGLKSRRGVWIGARPVYGVFLRGLLFLVMFWGLLMQTEL